MKKKYHQGKIFDFILKTKSISKSEIARILSRSRAQILNYTKTKKFTIEVYENILRALKITESEFNAFHVTMTSLGSEENENLLEINLSEDASPEMKQWMAHLNLQIYRLAGELAELKDTVQHLEHKNDQ